MVGFAHGHQMRNPQKFLEGHALSATDFGACDTFITAHYHHYRVQQFNHRLWIQIPSMDGGSFWLADRTGTGGRTPTGIVSLVVGEGYDPRRDLVVIGGELR